VDMLSNPIWWIVVLALSRSSDTRQYSDRTEHMSAWAGVRGIRGSRSPIEVEVLMGCDDLSRKSSKVAFEKAVKSATFADGYLIQDSSALEKLSNISCC
jgi:hypothetical protein